MFGLCPGTRAPDAGSGETSLKGLARNEASASVEALGRARGLATTPFTCFDGRFRLPARVGSWDRSGDGVDEPDPPLAAEAMGIIIEPGCEEAPLTDLTTDALTGELLWEALRGCAEDGRRLQGDCTKPAEAKPAAALAGCGDAQHEPLATTWTAALKGDTVC
mmetsp:Transcript_1436/g.3920  ORF Transcript_1436/g.3920 Transcript_1436/m.3920 type:complete len:163 (-) Transcript_1436:1923-2411(-)